MANAAILGGFFIKEEQTSVGAVQPGWRMVPDHLSDGVH